MTRDDRSEGRLLFRANYPLGAPGLDEPVIALYCGCEFFIVAPVPGREARAENTLKNMPRNSDGQRAFKRAVAGLFCYDNCPESVHVDIRLQKKGAQVW